MLLPARICTLRCFNRFQTNALKLAGAFFGVWTWPFLNALDTMFVALRVCLVPRCVKLDGGNRSRGFS